MTEGLLQKLEEKMMMLLTEIEDARGDIQRLSNENAMLKNEKENHAKKLADLISLLDTVNSSDNFMSTISTPTMKPVLVQACAE